MSLSLLIDGKNTTYRSLFAGRGDARFIDSGYHPLVIWLRFVSRWVIEFKPDSIHVFWDCPREDVWRRKVYSEYKENRDKPRCDDITEKLAEITDAAIDILQYMNCRCYIRDSQEADDLIYAFCKMTYPNQSIIVSSDKDMSQIPWRMPNVKWYEPKLREFKQIPVNPVTQKALMGDSSDNIDGYVGIGEAKSKKLCENLDNLSRFLSDNDNKLYKRNISLIDLSCNPAITNNELYVMRKLTEKPLFDRKIIFNKALEYKIRGLQAEYASIVMPFRDLQVIQ